jgi:hypothetical protein
MNDKKALSDQDAQSMIMGYISQAKEETQQ